MQHEYIEKLNMQAILNATAMQDEFVKEQLVSFGKVKRHLRRPTHIECFVQSVIMG